jgi:hypothetical protein
MTHAAAFGHGVGLTHEEGSEMERFDHADELPESAGAALRQIDGESERVATEARVRALEEALGRLLTVSPLPAQLVTGVRGDEDAAPYLAAYDHARKAAHETLGPYQLDLGLARTRPELAPRAVGSDVPRTPTRAEFRRPLEREPELER